MKTKNRCPICGRSIKKLQAVLDAHPGFEPEIDYDQWDKNLLKIMPIRHRWNKFMVWIELKFR